VQSLNRNRGRILLVSLAIISALSLQGFSTTKAQKEEETTWQESGVLWRDPGNIRARDLYYGPGSKNWRPRRHSAFERSQRRQQSKV
jgi:hypothetical protein